MFDKTMGQRVVEWFIPKTSFLENYKRHVAALELQYAKLSASNAELRRRISSLKSIGVNPEKIAKLEAVYLHATQQEAKHRATAIEARLLVETLEAQEAALRAIAAEGKLADRRTS